MLAFFPADLSYKMFLKACRVLTGLVTTSLSVNVDITHVI